MVSIFYVLSGRVLADGKRMNNSANQFTHWWQKGYYSAFITGTGNPEDILISSIIRRPLRLGISVFVILVIVYWLAQSSILMHAWMIFENQVRIRSPDALMGDADARSDQNKPFSVIYLDHLTCTIPIIRSLHEIQCGIWGVCPYLHIPLSSRSEVFVCFPHILNRLQTCYKIMIWRFSSSVSPSL